MFKIERFKTVKMFEFEIFKVRIKAFYVKFFMHPLVEFHFIIVVVPELIFWPLGMCWICLLRLELYFYSVNLMASSNPILRISSLLLHPVVPDLLILELGRTCFGLLVCMLLHFSSQHLLKTFDGSSYLSQKLVFCLMNWTFLSHLTVQNYLWYYQSPISLDHARAWMVDSMICLYRCLVQHRRRGCSMLQISWLLLFCRLGILLLFGCLTTWSRNYHPFFDVPLHSGLQLPWNSLIVWKARASEVFLSSRWRFHLLGGRYFTISSERGPLNMVFNSTSRPLVCFHPGWRPRGSSAFLASRSSTCCLGYLCHLDFHLRQRVGLRASVTEETRAQGLSSIWRHHRVFVKYFWN